MQVLKFEWRNWTSLTIEVPMELKDQEKGMATCTSQQFEVNHILRIDENSMINHIYRISVITMWRNKHE